jgi:hypothetical protein
MSKKTEKKNSSEAVTNIDVNEASELVGGALRRTASIQKLTVRSAYVPRSLGSVAYCTSGGCTSHHCSSGFTR